MAQPSPRQLADRYRRLADQLAEPFARTTDTTARMATVVALLHHKLPYFFWTGFYRLQGEKLVVGPYQGPLACVSLPPPDGVCWAAVREKRTILVPDVHAFAGHVACDPRSRSEIVVPLRDGGGEIVGVLDVDSDRPDAFGPVDQEGLEQIMALIPQVEA